MSRCMPGRTPAMAALLPLLLLLLPGCEACFTFIPIEGARSEVVRGDDGAVAEIALAVSFDELQAMEEGIDGFEIAHAFVPIEETGDAFPILIDIGHNKLGHPPFGVWDVPHFDVHFYAMTEEQVLEVQCGAQPQITEEKIPAGFVVGECVDQMGVHAHEPREGSSTEPTPLKDKLADVIIGYNDGELSFIEPMIFADSVFNGDPLDASVGRPSKVGRATLWPARFEGRLDEDAGEYRFSLVDWTPIE